jgi:hypothetical protein
MTIRFKHFRNNPKFSYLNKGCTVCYEYDKRTNKLSFAIAQCHKNDTYSKKEGRDTSLDHYLNNNKITLYIKTNKINTLTSFFKEFALTLNEYNNNFSSLHK